MTFQRSLSISILFHILIFGSAIAFAGFTRGALWGHHDVIVVSLVDSGPASRGGTLQEIGNVEEMQSHKKPVASHTKDTAAISPETPPQEQETREGALMPAIQESAETGIGGVVDGNAGKGKTGDGVPGTVSGTQFGLIPAEQWAVIESALERSKTYPRMARERGIQGVVHVRFKLRPSGDVETVEIVRSSGYDILDDASVRTVYRAAPMPYVNGWVEVPMAYVLK